MTPQSLYMARADRRVFVLYTSLWPTHSTAALSTSKPQELSLRLDLMNHSPTGFSWGYGGSGPAQLALALCADVLKDDRRALDIYQDFKRLFVALLDGHSEWAASHTALRAIMTPLLVREAA